MAGANFDYDRASRALAIAALEGDRKAAASEGLSDRTLRNYRKRLETDPTLAELFRSKKELLEREWAHRIAPTLRAALDFIERASHHLNPGDPEAVHAMAGALKLVNEAGVTVRMVDAKLASLYGEVGEGHRPDVAVQSPRPVPHAYSRATDPRLPPRPSP